MASRSFAFIRALSIASGRKGARAAYSLSSTVAGSRLSSANTLSIAGSPARASITESGIAPVGVSRYFTRPSRYRP